MKDFNKFAVIVGFIYEKKRDSYYLPVMFKFLPSEISFLKAESYLPTHVKTEYIEVCLDFVNPTAITKFFCRYHR